ncbi:ABC transporter substrate-binding protein [Pseudoduganella umbonata]|uniref:ABC transporter substrate-binding protein n=1 Tax=Pseudoduganella umbonata TaxID=864828 RepID=A0A4P8HUL9_9BURK|nr:ABC transporter substrate-binding protein [Pseudoduganella umbonata]MBB3225244.1 peptide/nickel transport system substrate-binding protein [Pseudoduganella umbonata]QCP12260.1 ABC transporter substrate-binding protein [Pseudoduganella umbonata]
MTEPTSRRHFLQGGLLLGAAALGGSALLAGCGREQAATPAAPVDDTPRRGGRLRLGIVDGSQSGNLDVHKPVGSGIIRGFALYSKLWEWSEHMTPELALAEEVSINANASAWTIRLRKGLEFHHGKTITADDLIFSARRLSDPELASPYAALVSRIDRDNIVKLDERTIRVPIKHGAGFLPLPDGWVNFGGIVPTDYHPVTNPVGAGPYKLKSFNPGQRSLFTRFDNYFKPGQPYADELEIIEFKDQTSRVAALLAGQIDTAYALSPEQVVPLRANGGASVLVSRTHGWHGFEMNLDAEPFRDVRVRQAFRLLANRPELVARALGGHGRIANDLYSPLDPTFNKAIAQRPHDVEQARALLRAAGKADLRLELAAGPGGAPAAQVFANQAKLAGVDVRVRQVDAATYNGPLRDSWAMSTTYRLGGEFLHTASITDAPLAAVNKTHFKDARFAELFEQALGETDVLKRQALVHEAQQIQHDRGGLLIWGFTDVVDGIAANVGGARAERSHFPTWRFDDLWLRS